MQPFVQLAYIAPAASADTARWLLQGPFIGIVTFAPACASADRLEFKKSRRRVVRAGSQREGLLISLSISANLDVAATM
jgi:hypothetical protein